MHGARWDFLRMRREFLRPTVMLIFGVLSYKDFLVEHGGAMLIFGIVPYMDCFFFGAWSPCWHVLRDILRNILRRFFGGGVTGG